MSVRSAAPPAPVKPKRAASSGQHPAVKAYRKKLESIDENCNAAASNINRQLQEYLDYMKTPVPEDPPDGD